MKDLLLRNTMYLDGDCNSLRGCVGISDDRIDYIGEMAPDGYREVIDCSGCAAIPAFVNAHAHSPMSFLRGYAENLPLHEWLQKKIFPFEATLTHEDIYYACLLSFAEMLRFGCVSTNDMYYGFEPMSRAVAESGVKSNISMSVLSGNARALEEEYRKALYSMPDTNGRLKLDVAIHAVYTSTPEVVKPFISLARENNLRMHIHLSETSVENEGCKKQYGITPAEYFERLSLFELPTTAAHCVHLEDNDYDILKRYGVTAAVCPMSNLKLASGIPNIQKLLERGANTAIGTDSVASNNNLDMFGDMRFFALLPKGTSGDPTAVSPAQTIFAATRAGALSQGRSDCGIIKEGFKADIAVIDLNEPHLTPVHSLTNTLVYSANGNDVRMTVCDGKILYRDGKYTTIDVAKATDYVKARVNG